MAAARSSHPHLGELGRVKHQRVGLPLGEPFDVMADRIQARAVRRCGELLKQHKSPGARTDLPNNGAVARSQKEAGDNAGLSQRQRETAIGVANVAQEEFDAAVESDTPPPGSLLSVPFPRNP